jgi:hypothetical protein
MDMKCRHKGGEKRKLASSTPGLTVEPNQKTTNEQASKPMNYQELPRITHFDFLMRINFLIKRNFFIKNKACNFLDFMESYIYEVS